MAYIPSKFDTPEQRRFAFPRQQILSNMIRRYINIPSFNAARRNLQIVVEVYALGRCSLEGWDVSIYARALAACEVVDVCLPDECFAVRDLARQLFVKACLRYLCRRGSWTNTYSAGNDGAQFQAMATANAAVRAIIARVPVAQPPEDEIALIRQLLGLDNNAVLTDAHYTVDLAEAVAEIVDFLASFPTARGRAVVANQYVCAYTGLVKRGTVSTTKMAAINQAVSQETNLEINVTQEQVKALGTALGTYVDENNAREVMNALSTSISTFSLRLKLTVGQTLRSGMTQYWSILYAFCLFPTFPWDESSRYIPDDFTRFNIAMGLVGNNEYYGFSHNIGEAAHTRYKSLAWLAVQLLIKFRGAEYGSLVNYRGVTRNPDRQQYLQAMIDAFVPPAATNQLEGVNDIIRRGRAVITNMAQAAQPPANV